jgi:glycosyltransferase involved in cell wall biosynthesis
MASAQNKKLKIVFCTNSFSHISNGPAKFANILARNTNCEILEVRVITEDIEFSTKNIIKVYLNYPTFFEPISQIIRMWRYYRFSRLEFVRENFDFVIYNNAIVGLLSVILSRRKTIGMINDDNNLVFTISKLNLLNYKKVFYHYLERLFCIITRNPIIVNSNYLANAICNSYGIDRKKIKVFNKGIDESLVVQNRRLFQKKLNSILFVKTDFARGGLATLLEALNEMNEDVQATIVGASMESVNGIVTSLNLRRNLNLKIFEFQEQSEVQNLMREYDVFCVPSYKEAFGVANIEALSCGCKIVATNVGGIPEALNGAPIVWFVQPHNVAATKQALEEALKYTIQDADFDRLDNYLVQYSEINLIRNFNKILQDAQPIEC